MLRVLDEGGRVDSVRAWCRAYSGGADIEHFAADRCRLLVRVGLATRDEAGGLVTTALGDTGAVLVAFMRRFFGLGQR